MVSAQVTKAEEEDSLTSAYSEFDLVSLMLLYSPSISSILKLPENYTI